MGSFGAFHVTRHHSPATKAAQLEGEQATTERVPVGAEVGVMIVQRLCLVLLVLCLGPALGSCSGVAGVASDIWPHWAGGEPADIPPRPGKPGYEDYIAHQQGTPPSAKPAETAQPAVAAAAAPAAGSPPPAPEPAASPPAEENATVRRGGLY
jgi:hypothetical protein